MQLATLFLWIETSLPVRAVATTPLVYPAISALHLLGIALLFGSIVPVDLRLLRVLGPQLDPALPSLVNIAVLGFMLAATSGVVLATIRIGDYFENPAFRIKMIVLLAAGTNALLLRMLSGSPEIARIAAAASLALWIAAVVSGRWIAFV